MGLMSRAQRGSPAAAKGLEKRPGPVLQKRAHSVGQCEPYTLGILIHEHRANAGVHRASGVAAQEAVLEFTHREVATDTQSEASVCRGAAILNLPALKTIGQLYRHQADKPIVNTA